MSKSYTQNGLSVMAELDGPAAEFITATGCNRKIVAVEFPEELSDERYELIDALFRNGAWFVCFNERNDTTTIRRARRLQRPDLTHMSLPPAIYASHRWHAGGAVTPAEACQALEHAWIEHARVEMRRRLATTRNRRDDPDYEIPVEEIPAWLQPGLIEETV